MVIQRSPSRFPGSNIYPTPLVLTFHFSYRRLSFCLSAPIDRRKQSNAHIANHNRNHHYGLKSKTQPQYIDCTYTVFNVDTFHCPFPQDCTACRCLGVIGLFSLHINAQSFILSSTLIPVQHSSPVPVRPSVGMDAPPPQLLYYPFIPSSFPPSGNRQESKSKSHTTVLVSPHPLDWVDRPASTIKLHTAAISPAILSPDTNTTPLSGHHCRRRQRNTSADRLRPPLPPPHTLIASVFPFSSFSFWISSHRREGGGSRRYDFRVMPRLPTSPVSLSFFLLPFSFTHRVRSPRQSVLTQG